MAPQTLITLFLNMSILCIAFKPKAFTFLVNTHRLKSGTNDITFNQYDLKRIEFQKKLGLDLDDPRFTDTRNTKNGSDLRRNRKKENQQKSPKKVLLKHQITSKPVQPSKRFVLGNGVEGLIPDVLLSLVHSTVPYFFEDDSERLVLDDDYDINNDEDDEHILTNDKNKNKKIKNNAPLHIPKIKPRSLSLSTNKHTNTNNVLSTTAISGTSIPLYPWEHIFMTSRNIPITEHPSEDDRIRYFQLCIASHFSTVASYVPTDVDSKIRGHCWYDPSERVILEQYNILKDVLSWDTTLVSKRVLSIDNSPISGHNGEWLGCLIGALGALHRIGQLSLAKECQEIIDYELNREAMIFKKVLNSRSSTPADTMLLKIAMTVTHNVGDVDQGLSYWKNETLTPQMIELQHKYGRLAHERYERYDGLYGKAKLIYSKCVSAEGHRNYPLREAKSLRKNYDLLLPLSPWLENWGRIIATHPSLTYENQIQIIQQLLRGCDSKSRAWCVPNQIGYYRALYGISTMIDLEKMISNDMDKECKSVFREHEMRLQMSITDEVFASKLGRQARELLDSH